MERRPQEELTNIAREVVTNLIYVAWEAEMLISFQAILALASIEEDEAKQIGLVFEYMSKAGERAINGYPMFLSAQFIHVDDVEFFVNECRRFHEALK